MAITKNAWLRYKTLDKCFSSRYKKFYIEDLITECDRVLEEIDPNHNGISLRQIREDIAFMKTEEGWSIELDDVRDGKKLIYRYKDPKFSINSQPMNTMEAEQMRSALLLLQRFSGMPQFDWIQEFIPQLEKSFAINEKADEVIGYDDNVDLKGRHFLGELYQHCTEKNVLAIIYQGFHMPEPAVYTIHPYYLKQSNKRWFLFGWNEEADKLFNLPLDRIVQIDTVRKKYRKNSNIDFKEYFDDIIGVTKDETQKLTAVVLHCSPAIAGYIKTKPIAPSQKHKDLPDGSLEVRLKLIPNKELYALLLSYGSHLKVIQPQSIAELMKEEFSKGVKLYR